MNEYTFFVARTRERVSQYTLGHASSHMIHYNISIDIYITMGKWNVVAGISAYAKRIANISWGCGVARPDQTRPGNTTSNKQHNMRSYIIIYCAYKIQTSLILFPFIAWTENWQTWTGGDGLHYNPHCTVETLSPRSRTVAPSYYTYFNDPNAYTCCMRYIYCHSDDNTEPRMNVMGPGTAHPKKNKQNKKKNGQKEKGTGFT